LAFFSLTPVSVSAVGFAVAFYGELPGEIIFMFFISELNLSKRGESAALLLTTTLRGE